MTLHLHPTTNEAPRGACETNDGAEDEICPIYPFKEMTISGFLPYVNGQYQGRSWGWGGGGEDFAGRTPKKFKWRP